MLQIYNNEALAYCPNAVTLEYEGELYELAVVLGVAHTTSGNMKPHGVAHILDKHTYTNELGTLPTPDDLIKAAKNIKGAYGEAKKKKQVVYDPFKHTLVFTNGHYVYVVCLAKDKNELNYIQTLFPDTNANYLQNKRRKIQKRLKSEMPPTYK